MDNKNSAQGLMNPENARRLVMELQMEANQQIMTKMTEKMVTACFERCAGTSGDRLDRLEQTCLAACQDRYLQTRVHVQEAIQAKQDRDFS